MDLRNAAPFVVEWVLCRPPLANSSSSVTTENHAPGRPSHCPSNFRKRQKKFSGRRERLSGAFILVEGVLGLGQKFVRLLSELQNIVSDHHRRAWKIINQGLHRRIDGGTTPFGVRRNGLRRGPAFQEILPRGQHAHSGRPSG